MIEFDPDIQVPPHRVRRMLAALIAGLSPDAIGAEENCGGLCEVADARVGRHGG